MKEKLKTTRAVALDSNEYVPPFEFPNGTLFLYASIESKVLSPYQYWGRLKLENGQLKYVRLWAFSSLGNAIYYKGYARDELKSLRTVYASPTYKDTGYFVLFNNPDSSEQEQKMKKPQFTGKLYLEKETLLVTLWKQESLKGIYFSGTLELLKSVK